MRTILCLFEGVCTGAADGYARMQGGPAATIVHLGPGLANGLANLHNAKRANSPIVNIVGDHATHHRQFDAPLASDIMGLAKPVSGWLRTCSTVSALASDGAEAVEASMEPPGQVATLIVPADCAWGQASGPVSVGTPAIRKTVPENSIAEVARVLRSGRPGMILIGGQALGKEGLDLVGRIVQKTSADVMFETFSARLHRGARRFPVKRLPYFPEEVADVLADLSHLILVGSKPPVAFFAYHGKPSWLIPQSCHLVTLASPEENVLQALECLAEEIGASKTCRLSPSLRPGLPEGPLSVEKVGQTLGALLPEHAIVSDESVTSGAYAFALTESGPPHDWLFLTGGSMGQGLPVATGAAIACPDQRVICLQGDGGAMYTLQALWTQARECLDVTTVVFSNRKYKILQSELARAGLDNGASEILRLFDLSNPELDWVKLAQGMGVKASRAQSAEEFNSQFKVAVAEAGPSLIEAMI
jgi:acetolactate synthase-1/2/3 large subunit